MTFDDDDWLTYRDEKRKEAEMKKAEDFPYVGQIILEKSAATEAQAIAWLEYMETHFGKLADDLEKHLWVPASEQS